MIGKIFYSLMVQFARTLQLQINIEEFDLFDVISDVNSDPDF